MTKLDQEYNITLQELKLVSDNSNIKGIHVNIASLLGVSVTYLLRIRRGGLSVNRANIDIMKSIVLIYRESIRKSDYFMSERNDTLKKRLNKKK